MIIVRQLTMAAAAAAGVLAVNPNTDKAIDAALQHAPSGSRVTVRRATRIGGECIATIAHGAFEVSHVARTRI